MSRQLAVVIALVMFFGVPTSTASASKRAAQAGAPAGASAQPPAATNREANPSGEAKQATGRRGSRRAAAGVPDRALMQRIWDGWSTLDVNNVAQFYDKAADDVFFDITPLKYNGWQEYADGVKKVLAGFKSLKVTVGDDAKVLSNGTTGAIGIATWHGDAVMADGTSSTLDGRWTVVWAKRGGQWLIIHEHVSLPMGGGPQPSASPAKPE
jgi:ketosteroid isomerase-like protein